MVVYVDVLMLVNFIVNLFILHITVQTLRKRVKLKWLLISSLVGSLYVITVLYPSLKWLTFLPFKILIVIIMIVIVFHEKRLLFNIKASLIFLLYSILLAGMCFFIQMNSKKDMSFDVIIINFPYEKLLLSVMIIYMVIYRVVIFVEDRRKISTLIYTVDIVNKNYIKTIKAFLDTGNELRETASNLPVLIVERNILSEISLEKNNTYFIPYTVVNGTSGRFIGFKPEYINIHINKKNMERKDVIVAFCEYKLSKDNDYNGLMSRGILS
ncbi:sigma-E processing peptidase SpoIIGA [Clostridium estertheticum]|uniref:sigma-E processing peptidase SpoIIGA n=1 Tax=Clostridium estertheticum TaxID=238834 RepID=UPI001C0E1F70|nr:sigma-E processing peptidase SpoIIGA [Clostridium estertheticum]MBU3074376.1 sigma-E processing peptidase SpoIIGA [Clostridium estertheticum]MBU3164470.1 sigma-E processing peptidase SpoIIGA [Clostridium estertheticum]